MMGVLAVIKYDFMLLGIKTVLWETHITYFALLI